MDIETTTPNVRGDQNAALALPEVSHDFVTLFLGHVTMHARDLKIRIDARKK